MFLTHPKFMDVFIEVVKVQYRGHAYRKVLAYWWNFGYTGAPWLQETQTLKISNEKWAEFGKHATMPTREEHEKAK